jgi:hypothetical protein
MSSLLVVLVGTVKTPAGPPVEPYPPYGAPRPGRTPHRDVPAPVLNPALSIISVLPTPQLRAAAFLAVLRAGVTRRSGKGHTMTDTTVCLPATELINIDAMASVDTVVWWCRICDHHGIATTRPTAHSAGVEHLSAEHHATSS